jgi:hypothetical protein
MRRTSETIASIVNHVPRELRIAANGFDLGAQPVTGAVTAQELAVRLAEALAFIEIFDERGTLVCYWPATLPNDGALEQQTSINLGDGRQVDLQVALTDDCPRLRMRYTDERVSAAELTALDRFRASVADVNAPSNGSRSWQATLDEPAQGGRWWRWIVPSRTAPSGLGSSRFVPSLRVATAVGVLAVLWMIFVGPTTTWAALTHLGRAAVDVVRALISSPSPSPSSSAPVRVPSASPPMAPVAVAPTPSGTTARVFSASELADIEMDARVTLHAMKADLGEDIALTSSPAGGVVIQGVVASGARRVAIARAFTDRDGVRVQVRTVHDVATVTRMKGTRAKAAPSEVSTPLRLESPESLRPILEDVLIARFPEPAARASFVNATLAHADEALTRVWALRRTAER